jgi:hypothetical protein
VDGKVEQTLTVSKGAAQMFDMEVFSFRKLNDLEVKE